MSIASNIIGIMGGVFGMTLNSLGRPLFANPITVPAGTSSNCGVNFSNEGANSGIYCPTPGAVAFIGSGIIVLVRRFCGCMVIPGLAGHLATLCLVETILA